MDAKNGIRRFLADERGAVALDVVVLTAMLVGTTLAVMATFANGLETLNTIGPHVQLREDAVGETRFEGPLCHDGIADVQSRENGRASAVNEAPIDVAAYMQATYSETSLDELRAEWAAAQEAAQGDAVWTIERTRLGAVECELALRGLD